MTRMVRMVSLGKATQDLFVRSARDFVAVPGPRGRMIRLPLGVKLDLDDLTVTSGGNAANAATTFARQGLSSTFLWALGDDRASDAILGSLGEDGVDVGSVLRVPGSRPSTSVVLLMSSGERTILNHRGTVRAEDLRRIDLSPIADADWLYASSLAGELGILVDALAIAEAAGTRVLLNPAGTELAHLTGLLPLLPRVDVVAVNAEEARLLLGSLEPDAAALARAVARLGPAALVTDGARGAVWCDRRSMVSSGTRPSHDVVDSTGCGDAFASGFLSRFAQGAPVADCMAFAAANAAAVLGAVGARTGVLHDRTTPADIPIAEERIDPPLTVVPRSHGPLAPQGAKDPVARAGRPGILAG